MTHCFLDFLLSKRVLLFTIIALLYSAQTKLEAQNCDPDTLKPIAICDETVVVALSSDDSNDCYGPAGPNNMPAAFGPQQGSGITWVKALSFDDGSYDPCGNNIKLTVRRLAPYSQAILNLNTTNGVVPCNDGFPDFPSEFERAISEQDSIKFYAEEVGTTQTVILRAYKLNASGNFVIHPITGFPIFNECPVQVEIQDKLKPVCTPPANVTVTCEQFDPSLLNYGDAAVTDNACVDTTIIALNYANFDTVCNRGTLFRTFKAFDCSANSSECTQRIEVTYNQDYYLKFPNDIITNTYSINGFYGEPSFFKEDCELMGISYNDEVFTLVPDANIRIERTWLVFNWCTFNPNNPYIDIPNPAPNAVSNDPENLPGPTVSASGTLPPWQPTIVKINATDPTPTDYATFWDANANGYQYKQIIKVIDTFFVAVQGVVFSDSSANCTFTNGEDLLGDWTVKATGLTSGTVKEAQTNANGYYMFVFDGTDTIINITLVSSGNFGQNCQTNYNVNGVIAQTVTQDIPVHLEQRCALLSVGIAAPLLRRCFENRYTAEACNLSGTTVADAYVEVDLDAYLNYVESSVPATLVSGNIYRFNLGDLEAGDCRRFWIDVTVSCDAPLGYTHCTEAKIFPYDDCRGNNSNWTGADIDVTASCDGDSVRLKIKNIGDGPMAQVLDFVVTEDIIMLQDGGFQLGVGGELNLAYAADGSTWRLEAQEEPLHPFGGVQAVALEGCGGIQQTGLVNLFPLSDSNPFEGLDCQQNIGSFDPNDKQAFPVGFGTEHFLKSNTAIDYMIRFQNTGTDTAFTVKVLDSLSQYLTPSTVRVLSTSHPVEFSILDGNVLQFLFSNILLPDSNVNTVASNGFLKFRVAQQYDNPEGTIIENKAAIFFDFNEPVITNTTFHTINDHALSVGLDDVLKIGKALKVFPNPTAEVATFQFEKTINNGRFELKNQMGQSVRVVRFTGEQYDFERAGLPTGMYFFTILEENGARYTGKILVK